MITLIVSELYEMIFHRHHWGYEGPAVGELPKNNTPEPMGMIGFTKRCICGARLFIPSDPRLRPVKIVAKASGVNSDLGGDQDAANE